MSTLAEVRHALRRLTLDERQEIAEWLERYRDEETGAIGVAEPAAGYAVELPYMTVEEYLEFEERSTTRHEYINGVVHAMCGASLAHNRIVTRLHLALEKRLGGGPCEIFLQDLKLKVESDADNLFYYPDVMVACDKQGWGEHFIHNPKLVIEVLSPTTQSIDLREKALSYKRLPSVEEYVVVAQKECRVTVYRRAERWEPQIYSGPEAMLELRSVGLTVPLDEVYRTALADA